MQLGGEPWVGDSAKARIKDTLLSLNFVSRNTAGTHSTRDQVKLSILDFEGPGIYTVTPGSMFVAVTINRAELLDSENTEAKTAGVLKGALGGSATYMLDGGQVVVTSVTKSEVEGTFQWTPRTGSPSSYRPLTDGKFRAIVK